MRRKEPFPRFGVVVTIGDAKPSVSQPEQIRRALIEGETFDGRKQEGRR